MGSPEHASTPAQERSWLSAVHQRPYSSIAIDTIDIIQNSGGLKGPSEGPWGSGVQLRCGCARARQPHARLPCRLRSPVPGALPRHLPMPLPPG